MAFWDKKKKKKTAQDEAYEKAKAREKEIKKTRKRLKKAGLSAKKAKEEAPKSGKVRKGAKGAEVTKGGTYVKYGKKTAPAASFRSAFAAARKAGKSSFTWDGRSYSTARADDKKKTAPKKVDKKKVAPPKKKVDAKDTDSDIVTVQGPNPGPTKTRKYTKMEEGGKVEGCGDDGGGMFNWPSRDARNGGKK